MIEDVIRETERHRKKRPIVKYEKTQAALVSAKWHR